MYIQKLRMITKDMKCKKNKIWHVQNMDVYTQVKNDYEGYEMQEE